MSETAPVEHESERTFVRDMDFIAHLTIAILRCRRFIPTWDEPSAAELRSIVKMYDEFGYEYDGARGGLYSEKVHAATPEEQKRLRRTAHQMRMIIERNRELLLPIKDKLASWFPPGTLNI